MFSSKLANHSRRDKRVRTLSKLNICSYQKIEHGSDRNFRYIKLLNIKLNELQIENKVQRIKWKNLQALIETISTKINDLDAKKEFQSQIQKLKVMNVPELRNIMEYSAAESNIAESEHEQPEADTQLESVTENEHIKCAMTKTENEHGQQEADAQPESARVTENEKLKSATIEMKNLRRLIETMSTKINDQDAIIKELQNQIKKLMEYSVFAESKNKQQEAETVTKEKKVKCKICDEEHYLSLSLDHRKGHYAE